MALTKVASDMFKGFLARTFAQLSAITGGGQGSDPGEDMGLQFYADNDSGNREVFAAIQTEISDTTPGSEAGRLHFLVNDDNFLQVIGTVNQDGSWILGPGAPEYIMDIAGQQTINDIEGDGAIFGERISLHDPDYEDCRGIAIRNTKITDLNSLSYRAGIGFSILNDAGKERPTGYLRARYSDRSAGYEYSYMYPTTLVSGVQIAGPFFYNNGIGFDGTAIDEAHKLGAYEEGTWTPEFVGDTGSISGSWNTEPTGHFTIIGNLLFVTFYGYMVSPSGYPTGNVRVTGLPVTIEYGLTGLYTSITAGYLRAGNTPSTDGCRWQAGGSDQMYLRTPSSEVSWGSSGAIDLSGSGVFEIA